MLKAPEQLPPAEPDRSIGDVIERLFDDAIAYGRAELELLKLRALGAAQSYARAAVLFAVAALFGLAGLVTLFVGIAFGLAHWLGPLGGAVVATLIAVAIAGLLAWLAIRDLDQPQ